MDWYVIRVTFRFISEFMSSFTNEEHSGPYECQDDVKEIAKEENAYSTKKKINNVYFIVGEKEAIGRQGIMAS